MKNTLNEEKLRTHFTPEDVENINATANQGLQFLESDPEDAAAIEAMQKTLEGKFNPIMMRVYQAAGPDAAPQGGMPGMGGAAGPGGAPADTPMDDLD